jgi:hypothetical protein
MRWEYCAVVGIRRRKHDLSPYYPAIWYFTSGGAKKQEIQGSEALELGRAIAALGDQGWEMVGMGDLGSPEPGYQGDTALFFKRPKP